MGLPAAWVTVDAGANLPHAFFSLVVAALRGINPHLLPITTALLADEGTVDINLVVLRLIDELSAVTEPFVLVLDDYHTVEAQETHNAVDLLLERVPPGMQVVLISRSVPPLRLARPALYHASASSDRRNSRSPAPRPRHFAATAWASIWHRARSR